MQNAMYLVCFCLLMNCFGELNCFRCAATKTELDDGHCDLTLLHVFYYGLLLSLIMSFLSVMLSICLLSEI
jgi:hypothetical protein